jgi:biotin carboxyl carrier protein
MSDTTLSLLVDDRSYDIESERLADGGQNLLVRGHVVHVDVLDLRKVRLRRVQEATGADTGPAKITSPMPGKVVAVLVKEGDTVAAGQGLLVVEAMKMENELKAPRAGVVKNLTATEGTPVDGGTTLCVIE